MRKPAYNFSNLSTTTSTFLSKLGVTSVNTNPVNITVRHSWGYAVSSAKASSSGSIGTTATLTARTIELWTQTMEVTMPQFEAGGDRRENGATG